MDRNAEMRVFLDSTTRLGITGESLISLLKGRGWPEEDIHRALADDFELRSGLPIPAYKRSGSAKDAFLYLLSFSTLATWAVGLGSVLFALIDRQFKDPLSTSPYYTSGFYQMADSLACVIVAFPVYLLTMRYITRALEIHPEKLESAIRKWLTYLALLMAAGFVVGDLIAFLTYFLRGELTARFIAKVFATLVIAGGIFWFYLGSLSKRAPTSKITQVIAHD